MKRSVLLFPLLLISPACDASADFSGEEEAVFFLVRHAERAEDGTDDPHISEAGRARADILATLLADAGVTHIHSTDLHRTRETAAPLAVRNGVAVETYGSDDPAPFAARLRVTPGRHLVVGHSNTIPELVQALGGDPGPSIEALEYDRLYLLVPSPHGVNTVLLRFGSPFRN